MFNQTILLNELNRNVMSWVGSGGIECGGTSAIVVHSTGHTLTGTGGMVVGGSSEITYTYKDMLFMDVQCNTKSSKISAKMQPTGYVEEYSIAITSPVVVSQINSALGTFVITCAITEKSSAINGRLTLTYNLQANLATKKSSTKSFIASGNALNAFLSSKASTVGTRLIIGYNLSAILVNGLSRINGILFNGGLEKCLVINTQSTALSEYTNFIPDSIIEHNRRYYAAFSDGIYLLEGVDDAGTTIDTTVRTGQQDLGIMQQKNVQDVFVSGSFDGASTFVSSYTDNERIGCQYPLISYGDGVNKRAKLSKATKSRYWGFEITGANQIDVVEIPQSITSRRI